MTPIASRQLQVTPKAQENTGELPSQASIATAVDKDEDGGSVLDASSAKLWKTESQQWGAFYTQKRPPGVDPFSSQRSCWQKPRSKCDVTDYGDR